MRDEQMIISIGREYGSGGHVIAEMLAERFNLPLYDKNILSEVCVDRNLSHEELERYDEVPKMRLFSRTVRGYCNSPEVNIANLQFEYMLKLADEGKSFVIVGRCAEEVLREHDCLTTVFVLGNKEDKIKRTQFINGNVSREDAKRILLHSDKTRKAYHNYYCKGKWGDSRNYELSVNSSVLGYEGTADFIADFINRKYGVEN